MEFVLDTNAYRNLARKLDLIEIPAFAQKLINAERAIGAKSVLSIVVSMELIQHLLDGDLSKEECYKALCLQYFHTSSVNYGEGKRQGSLYPPMNIILTKFFFNENSKYLLLYNPVLGLISKLAEPLDGSICAAFEKDIKTIKEQLIFEKEEFKDNLEEYLKSLNKGVLDWGYFRNTKEARKKYFRELQNGRVENLLAISLMFRAHRIMNYDELISDAENRLNDFLIEYSVALRMCVFLLEQVGHGTNLSDVLDHRWNTLNDVQILFGMLYKSNSEEKIIVTEEGKIHDACDSVGRSENVLSLDEYLSKLNITAIP